MAKHDQKTLQITLKDGLVEVLLFPDVAPKHVERIMKLSEEGLYNNVVFHRVIDGFMAQTGDVQFGNMNSGLDMGRAGTGGSKEKTCQLNSQSYLSIGVLSGWLVLKIQTRPIVNSS